VVEHRIGGQPARQRRLQLVHQHGLGDVVVEAGCQAALPVRAGGAHGDDRGAARGALAPADLGGGLEAVDVGELAVHQHHPVGAPRGLLHRFQAARRHVGAEAEPGQQPYGHHPAELVVLDQQDVTATWDHAPPRGSACFAYRSGSWLA
jgi:hypothetical protein